MTEQLDFSALWPLWPELLAGLWVTVQLTVLATTGGLAIGIFGAAIRSGRPTWYSRIWGGYVELIRNTPFVVQLFFIVFGLPNLGLKMTAGEAALLAMVVNLGAYSTEIVRAGIQVTPKGQWEAGRVLGLSRLQTFMRVILPPALQRIYPALVSQCIIVMLGSSVVSQVSYEELTFAANLIQSRTFLSFEVYLVTTGIYLMLSITMRQLLMAAGGNGWGAGMMTTFTDWDIVRNLLLAGRWTVLLSLVAFIGGALVTLPLLLLRLTGGRQVKRLIRGYIELFQGTPLLMQLFLAFFGVALFGIDVSAWTAASLALTFYTSAFLLDIGFGSIRALPKGQWEASRCLGLSFSQTLCRVIAPQALRIAIAPTVGFAVQVIKGTALASIIGFVELTKAGTMLTNVTYQPFKVFALVALGYFILCYPLSRYSRYLENKFNASHHH